MVRRAPKVEAAEDERGSVMLQGRARGQGEGSPDARVGLLDGPRPSGTARNASPKEGAGAREGALEAAVEREG
jgi:hypothetical protein